MSEYVYLMFSRFPDHTTMSGRESKLVSSYAHTPMPPNVPEMEATYATVVKVGRGRGTNERAAKGRRASLI